MVQIPPLGPEPCRLDERHREQPGGGRGGGRRGGGVHV